MVSSVIESNSAKEGDVDDLDFWSRRYVKEGHIWGDDPSMTAELLAEQLNPVSNILEVGFGYGRDIIELVQQGHRVTGVEMAIVGLNEATRQLREKLNAGQAHLHVGEFSRASLPKEEFDAVFSHRMLHLLGQNGLVRAFANRAAGILKPDGLLYVSARDPRDFNPEQMIKHPDKTVTYREDIEELGDRKGQLITLWDEARFRETFEKKFDILGFKQGQEIESQVNPIPSYFTIMMARKKKDISEPRA